MGMAVAAVDSRALLQDAPPELTVFLQFFGTVCSVPAVALVGLGTQGSALDVWVRLTSADDASQDAVYDALQKFRAAGDGTLIDLHVIFPDEDESAWPGAVRVVYTRE
jgi:hypothetical protein